LTLFFTLRAKTGTIPSLRERLIPLPGWCQYDELRGFYPLFPQFDNANNTSSTQKKQIKKDTFLHRVFPQTKTPALGWRQKKRLAINQ
jgi:hypothetical protein